MNAIDADIPGAAPRDDKPFLMSVEDVFSSPAAHRRAARSNR